METTDLIGMKQVFIFAHYMTLEIYKFYEDFLRFILITNLSYKDYHYYWTFYSVKYLFIFI